MPVSLELDRHLSTAYLSGEIDHHTAKDLREKIDAAITHQRPQELVLDFSHVSFMDSSGIGLVMGRYKLMQGIGGKVRVRGVTPQTQKVMKLAGLDLLTKIEVKEQGR